MTKTSYVVTDVAGNRPDIAGSRRKVGDTISLTDKEAEYELSRKTIVTLEQHEKDQRKAASDASKAKPAPAPEPAAPRKES